jgi:hypothetical protein
MPESYLMDPEVFPEKAGDAGSIYVEAGDKVTLKKIREITFINARDVLGIIYTSKSGNTRLKWRQIRGKVGRVTGEASANSLVNLITTEVISREYAEELAKGEVKKMEQASVKEEEFEESTQEEVLAVVDENLSSSISESPGLEEVPHIDEDS